MTEKTVDEIRAAIIENLYKLWMEDSGASWIFGDSAPNEDWEPAAKIAIRECKQMEYYGWVEILSSSDVAARANVRLTPHGRETWESFLTLKEKNPSASLSEIEA